MNDLDKIALLEKALAREKSARKQAEKILEAKSLELYQLNLALKKDLVDMNEELEEAETLFGNLIELADDVFFKANLKGDFTYINPTIEKNIGYTPQELIGTNFIHLIREDYKDLLMNHFKNQQSELVKSSYIEFPILSKSGEEVWVGQSTNLVIEKNLPVEFFALTRNITNRIKNDQDLKILNVKLEKIISNLSGAILVEDEYRRINLCNQEFCNLFQIPLPPTQLIGLDCSNAAQQSMSIFENPDQFLKDIEFIIGKRETKTGDKLFMKNGTILSRDYIPLYIENEFNGQIWHYRDITFEEKNNEIIKKSEEKYRGVIENLELGILEVNLKNEIIKAYPKFCELTGYKEDEILGKNPSKTFLPKEFQQIMEDQTKKRYKGESSVYEVPLLAKNGDWRWALISGAPFYNEKGEFAGTIGIHVDITDRKKMEAELKASKKEADEMNRLKELFLANISHEMRTPLNAIVGLTDLLETTKLNQKQKNYLSPLKTASENLLALVEDVLDFSKIEANKIHLEEQEFEFDEFIQGLEKLHEIKAKEKGIALNIEIDKKIENCLNADKHKISQIITNLITNAIKFTEIGSVTLKATLIDDSLNKQIIQFKVKDTGIGISSRDTKFIFENFSQASNVKNKNYGGTGLGLSISKKIVELMGGNLTVKSKLNVGSVFSFTIPLKKGKKHSFIENNPQLSGFAGHKRLLIAEDNAVNQLLIEAMLNDLGMEIDIAENGLEVIEKLKINNYDIILMDINMPLLNGIETTLIIRNELELKTPIIALTANAIKGDREKFLGYGMDDYLSKPFKKEDLIALIQSWLSISNYKFIDLLKIKSLGEPDFIKKMISLLLEELQKSEGLLINEKLNNTDLYQLTHKIKPSLGYICKKNVFEKVSQLEIAFQKNEKAAENIQQLITLLKQITSELLTLE